MPIDPQFTFLLCNTNNDSQLTRRSLPPEFDRKRKQGFSIPLAEWLKAGPFRDLFWDTLTSSECLFDSVTVRGLLKGQDKRRSNGERIFALVQFELWRREYAVS
jgi:asparagine synthase (glutamine-hydrolysing)